MEGEEDVAMIWKGDLMSTSRINNMVVLKSVVQTIFAQFVLDRHFPGMVGLI
jgi:hypothetical protein